MDQVVLHEAKPLRAEPTVAILEQHAFGRRAARCLHALEILGDRGAQLALAPGVKPAEALELRGDFTGIEDGRGAARGINERIGLIQHRHTRISEPSRAVTAGLRRMVDASLLTPNTSPERGRSTAKR